jgi:ABC-type Fe3+-hydroxamate transport system substrate-binding protein
MGAPREVVVDALGREVPAGEAGRVVSLVPSETESVVLLGGLDRLAGRTDYCVEPPEVAAAPSIGGTKNVDVDAVVDLRPDLVLANQEENTKTAVEALIARGLRVHVSFPRTVDQSVAHLADLARLLGLDPGAHPLVAEVREAFREADAARARGLPGRDLVGVFVPVWKDPWMTFDGRAFASDLLELSGFRNVFSDRPRRYPLAADLGRRAPLAADRVGDRDTRYPRVSLAEVRDRNPSILLLPDEPYAFDEAGRTALLQEPLLSGTPWVTRPERVRLVSGRDLFWYGVHLRTSLPALRRLRASVASV